MTAKYHEGSYGTDRKQRYVVHHEYLQQARNHLESSQYMDAGHDQRYEEHHQNLFPYGLLYLALAHTYLLHDLEFVLVVIAFRNLLIVNDQRRRKGEHDAQEDAQEQETSYQSRKIFAALLLAVDAHHFKWEPQVVYLVLHFLIAGQFFLIRSVHIQNELCIDLAAVATVGFCLHVVDLVQYLVVCTTR